MICRIPFIYSAAVVLKGHRKIEHAVYGAWTDVEVPETFGDDAPVALSWLERRPHLEPRLRETRWFEDSNWKPADAGTPYRKPVPFHPAHFERLRELDRAHAADHAGFSHLECLAMATGQRYYELRSFVGEHDIREYDGSLVRELLYSGRGEAEAAAAEAAKNLLFVDGCLWIKGGEPHYALVIPGLNCNPGQPCSVIVSEYRHPGASVIHDNRFRADRLEDAVDLARDISGVQEIQVPSRIEISISDAVQFDDEGEALSRAAAGMVEKGQEVLRHASFGAVTSWAALRDASEAGADSAALAELLADFRDRFPQHHDIARTVDHALKRWDLRPVGDSEMTP